MILVEAMPLDELIDWCDQHTYMMLAVYHGSLRYLTPVSLFRKTGGLRMSAFDSTHADEGHPNTYKMDELQLIGITRVRPIAVQLKGDVDG